MMAVPSVVRSIGGKIATGTGYPFPIRFLINKSPIIDNICASKSSKIERGVKLAGKIDLGENTVIQSGSQIRGNVKIDEGCTVRSGSRIRGDITIKRGTVLNDSVEMMGGEITIGKYCAIARNSTFQSRNHKTDWPSMQLSFYKDKIGTPLPTECEPICIGNDVWIGTKAIILPGVTIGDGAIVAAGAIVVDDVEPYSLVAGVPASHRKYRFEQPTREKINNISWWDWSEEKISRNEDFFHTDLNQAEDIENIIK
ncbi:CatB-related O-acetyltransferase [Natrinema amylolyticum]|uniref:xenobiotic acyltransferase family protein n=1 Tax=Natrinema amylolyticum TaxID=2878679 RepID=UPI00299D220C|nr:CatB-related O-acetyltransferase [Natrinema amylolyticum]